MKKLLKKNATRLTAILIILIFYGFAQLLDISKTERKQLNLLALDINEDLINAFC